jgi:hypothetical protein
VRTRIRISWEGKREGGCVLSEHITEAEFMNVQFRCGFWASSSEFSDLRFPYTMFTLHTSFKPFLLKEGGEYKIRCRGDCE